MAAVANANIMSEKTPIQIVDLRVTSKQPAAKSVKARSITDSILVTVYHVDFNEIVDRGCRHTLLLSSAESSRNPFFHDACVYVREHDELYVTSDLLQSTNNSRLPVVLISLIKFRRGGPGGDVQSVEWVKLRPPPEMPMPAGAALFGYGILYCSQGNLSPGTGGLYHMPRGRPPEEVVTNFHGREFNSVRDVAVSSDGCLWFTDPDTGFEQDFRKRPQLPCHLYRFQPEDGGIRVMADGFTRPGSVALSPDEHTIYVTEMAAAVVSDVALDLARPASIYAFDIIQHGNSPFLANRRVFAYALKGVPAMVRCDARGNVYAGCADGIEVWNAGGTLLGVIEVPGGVSSFCIVDGRELFVCAGQRLWFLQLDKE